MWGPVGPPDWRARIDGRRVVVSVSGGKDSAAVCLALRAAGVDFDMVFCDTGWESRETYAYLRGPFRERFGEVTEIRRNEPLPAGYEIEVLDLERRLGFESDMVRVCVRKAMLPSRMRRWCTDELKTSVFKAWCAEQGQPIVNAIGVRGGESASRSRLDEWEPAPWDGSISVWRPIFHWTYDDVVRAHRDTGLAPNPLYLDGAHRVGCWLCIQARKSEIGHVSQRDPERIAIIRDLEALVSRIRGDGRSWYQNPNPKRDPATRKVLPGEGRCWPIDRIVAWAQSGRGARDFDLPADGSCMRWGFCESPGSVHEGGP